MCEVAVEISWRAPKCKPRLLFFFWEKIAELGWRDNSVVKRAEGWAGVTAPTSSGSQLLINSVQKV